MNHTLEIILLIFFVVIFSIIKWIAFLTFNLNFRLSQDLLCQSHSLSFFTFYAATEIKILLDKRATLSDISFEGYSFCNNHLWNITFIKLIKFINFTCFPFRSWIYFIWVYFIFFWVISFFLILLLWLIVFFVFAFCRIRLSISIVSCVLFATICWFTLFILFKRSISILHISKSFNNNPYRLRCLSINFSRHFTLPE